MNPKTGEIKNFEKEFKDTMMKEKQEEQKKKTYHKIPEGWIGLPMPGDVVEVVTLPNKKRGRMWKVVDIVEGKPGKMVLEPCVETVNKCKKRK